MKAVITVIGSDKVGIIAALTAVLAKRGVNILDISQTIMQELFTMVMMVDLCGASFDEMREELLQLGTQIGVDIRLQNTDIFEAMHRI